MAFDERVQSDGVIYPNNDKQKQTQPDKTGKIELSKDVLKQLVNKVKAHEPAVLRVALWDRVSKNHTPYQYCRVDIPREKKESFDDEPPKKETPKEEPPKEEHDFDDIIPF